MFAPIGIHFCPEGHVHVQLGSISMHLMPEEFVQLSDEFQRFANDLRTPPRLSLVPNYFHNERN